MRFHVFEPGFRSGWNVASRTVQSTGAIGVCAKGRQCANAQIRHVLRQHDARSVQALVLRHRVCFLVQVLRRCAGHACLVGYSVLSPERRRPESRIALVGEVHLAWNSIWSEIGFSDSP
jgi:hypothetical protein